MRHRPRLLLALTALALPLQALHAQTVHTWTGALDSDFTNPANWIGGVPPIGGATPANVRYSVQGSTNPLIYTAAQGTSTYNTNGGSTFGRTLFIASGGTGAEMIINGGTFDSRGVSPDGMSNNASGTLTIDGGTYTNINGGSGIFLVKFNGAGTGTLNVISGTFLAGQLQFGDTATSSGTGVVNLNGGLLSVHRVVEANGTANPVNSTFNFNGGTLQARVNATNFMQNLNAANILAGGATIDTAGAGGTGVTVTINQNLLGTPGDGGLTKTGPGTLILTGTNSHTGTTAVNEGILRITNNSALGTTASGTTVANNARLELSGGITVSGEALTISGNGNAGTPNDFSGALRSISGNNTWTGPITLGTNGARVGAIGAGQTLRLSGPIGDGGNNHTFAVRSDNSGGTVILSGANTYGGSTDIVVGLVQLDGGANRLPIGTTLNLGNNSNQGSAILDLNGFNQQVAGLANLGTTMPMAVTNSSATPSTLTVNNPATVTYNGQLTGNLALTKTGAGLLVLGGTNSHTGTTAVNQGALRLTNGAALGTTAGTTTVANNARLELSGGITVSGETITIAGHGGNFFGALQSQSGTNTWAGNVNIAANGTRLGAVGASSVLVVSGTIADAGAGHELIIRNNGGTTILSGANTHSGLTNVFFGTTRATNALAFGTTTAGTTVASTGRLELAGGITVSGEALTISGTGGNFLGALHSLAGHNTWDGPITLGANDTRIGANGPTSSLTISGPIGDGGNNFNLVVRNADNGGPTILSGASTYGGNTDVLVGTLRLAGGDDRLPTGTTLRIGNPSNVNNATFDLNGFNQSVAGLQSLGTTMPMTVTNSSATPSTLTVNNSTAFTYNGQLTGNLALTKTGAGSLTLGGTGTNATNTFTGLTTISGGNLFLNKPSGIALGGDVLINGGNLRFQQNNQIANTANVTLSSGVLNGAGVNTGQRANHTETIASLTVTGGTFQTGNGGNWTITGAGSFTGGTGARFIGNSGAPGSAASFGSLSLTNMNGAGGITAANAFDLGAGSLTSVFVGAGGLALNNSNIRLSQGNGGSRLVLDGNVATTGTSPSGILLLTGTTGVVAPRLELSSTAGTHTRTFTTAATAPLTINVAITDGAATTANLVKAGAGTLILSGSNPNTYSGLTTVNAGILALQKAANVTAVPGDLLIQGGGRVTLANNGQLAATSNVTMSGAGSVFNGTAANAGQGNVTQTLASLTVTGGAFNAASGGNWTITGASSFTGGAGNTSFVGNSGTTFFTDSLSVTNINGNAGANAATPNTFTLYGNSTANVSTLHVGAGGLQLQNSRIYTRTGQDAGRFGSVFILDGDVSVSGGIISTIQDGGGGGFGTFELHLSSTPAPATRTIHVAGPTTDFAINVPVTNGASSSAGITKTGDGIFRFSGPLANSYTGLTTISEGTFQIHKNNNVTAVPGDLLIENGSRVTFTNNGQFSPISNVTMTGAGSSFNGLLPNDNASRHDNHIDTIASLTVSGGAFTTGFESQWTVIGATSFIGGTGNTSIIGNSGTSLTTDSLSLVDMSATRNGGAINTPNSFTLYGNRPVTATLAIGAGGLYLENSVINMTRGNAGAQGSRIVLDGDVATGGTTASRIAEDTISIGGTTGLMEIQLSSTAGTHNRTFDIAGGGADLSLAVPITDGAATQAGITKTGVGTLDLLAASTYSGPTNVTGGTLLVNNSTGSATGTGAVVVSGAGATLGGAGRITPGATGLSILSGGTLSPGNSPDSLTVDGDVLFGTGSSFELDLAIDGFAGLGDGTSGTDRLIVTNGPVNITGGELTGTWGGTAANIFDGTADASNMLWTITGADALSGTFDNTAEAPGYTALFGGVTPHLTNIDGQTFAVFYDANFASPALFGGNDLLLIAVPEPSRALLLALALTPLLLRRRRTTGSAR